MLVSPELVSAPLSFVCILRSLIKANTRYRIYEVDRYQPRFAILQWVTSATPQKTKFSIKDFFSKCGQAD